MSSAPKVTPRMVEEAVRWVELSGVWRKHGFKGCEQCGDDMFGPMLERDLWMTIAHHKREMLCEQCMEARLGRKIQVWDMNGSWWNVYRCSFILVYMAVSRSWARKDRKS